MDIDDVIYDGFSFKDNGIVVTNIDHMQVASRNNQLETRANRNGAILIQSLLGTKPVLIEGFFDGEDITDAQSMYDTLAQALNRQERVLEVPHAGGSRQYVATPQNVVIQEPNGLNRLTFSFEFVVPEGSSEEPVASSLVTAQVVTTPTTTIPIDVAGSAKARPQITLTFGTITGGTDKTVSVRNSRDYVGMTIERNWSSGDVVIIDSKNFAMYINGVKTEHSGRFPSWDGGTGGLYYADTLTTRSVTIDVSYYPRNL